MKRKDDHYWEQKIRFFLHDPVDKALKIPGHEGRAKKIADAFGVSTPDKSEVVLADIIASGLDRANLPGYSTDDSRNGAIDFFKYPQITHPISGGIPLNLCADFEAADITNTQIVNLIKNDTDRLDIVWDKQTYFNYLFFILRKRLISENCGGLGHLWDRLPADSRIPDHSIWNHCGMVSALGSSFAESDNKRVSMVVFAITPVQSFIGKTRKLRGHWVASVILSWLTFEGIAAIMENLGPDHIVYPSLQDQPLVEAYLEGDFSEFFKKYQETIELKKDSAVASLPNKFVFLAPSEKEETYVNEIKKRIKTKWEELSDIVFEYIGKRGGYLETMFNRQIRNWWQFGWSSSYLVTLDNQQDMAALFEKEKFASLFETIKRFSESYRAANVVYPASHSLVQTALAVSKSQPLSVRESEPGIKCPVCGELEALYDDSLSNKRKNATDLYWEKLSQRFGESSVKKGEKLCAICSIKRFAPAALKKNDKTHLLKTVFKKGKFPSTTEMATWEFRQKLKEKQLINDDALEQKLIDELHENDEKYSNDVRKLLTLAKKQGINKAEEDNYYAILIMDGDKMGDLVNGTTIDASWSDVLHPELFSRYKKGVLKEKQNLWSEYFTKQRILSPALHATISESLGAFSLYAVPKIIAEHNGKLIYAGGDDIAAVLPLSEALDAARKIQKIYNLRFATVDAGRIKDAGIQADGKKPVFLLPGKGEKISISAGLLVCHHKQPLRGALEEAHCLLSEVAKDKIGRNAFAVRLKKRSGQERDFAANWDKLNVFFNGKSIPLIDSFRRIQAAYTDGLLSSSLIYRIPEFKVMIGSILLSREKLTDGEKEKIIQVLAYEVGHSGSFYKKYPGNKNRDKRKTISRELAAHIAGISIFWNQETSDKGRWEYNGEEAIIARYLARGGDQQ